MKKTFMLFNSTQDAIQGDFLCRQHGVPVTIVPVPRELSSECGIAMEINPDYLNKVEELLSGKRLSFRRAELQGND